MQKAAHKIKISEKIGTVTGLLYLPKKAKALLVLGHGAGAGMYHAFMEQLAMDLTNQQIATLRYQFPYMEKGSRRPDSPKKAHPTIAAVIETAKTLTNTLPIYVGGKSFSGRMSSQLASLQDLNPVKGLIFFGYPLHPIGKEGVNRAEHLNDVKLPMLFLQGTRDKLAEVSLIQEVCDRYKQADLQFFNGADHSFKMLKRSGRTQAEIIEELAKATAKWIKAKSLNE